MIRLKDIVNRDSVTLTNCESEPIHIPGTIQPHGFLLGISDPGFIITYCSANAEPFLSCNPRQIIGQCMAQFFSSAEYTAFQHYAAAMDLHTQPFVFTIEGTPYNTTVHKSGTILVLEFEAFPDGSLALPDLYTQTRKFVSMIEGASNLQSLCQAVADETRQISGYDRVMIYRFDKDYNGEVFAESKAEGLEPFLGLNYPHTDIPAQARELYLRNLMRMIADVDYTPVPILAPDDAQFEERKNLDLSLSVLRSVSPIHIEYLKNMGVRGTMSISLVHNKKLWGLIACHHYSPKNIPHYTRLAAKLQGHFLTSQIDVRQQVEALERNKVVEQQLGMLLKQLDHENILEHLCRDSAIHEFIRAEGCAILTDGGLYTCGTVPEDDFIKTLAHWLSDYSRTGELVTSKLAALYPAALPEHHKVAGIVYYSLGKSKEECIIWFRPEVVTTINWAGNPDKAIVQDNAKEGLSPRKSFELWKQNVRDNSLEWLDAEISGSFRFASALQKQLHFAQLSREEEKLRKLANRLRAANEELKNMNWISTHDLREPLRKIQMFGSKIADNAKLSLPDTVINDVNKMRSIAARMQHLLNDILDYSLISGKERSFVPTDLDAVLSEVLNELQEEIAARQALIQVDPLPGIAAIPFQMRQLFINLLQNALKFSKPDQVPEVSIGYAAVAAGIEDNAALQNIPYHRVRITDNGIGFENIYAERILNIFQRLHGANEYSGTGIGLAICKKIMENHDGLLQAEGQPGAGATFTVWLPQLPVPETN
ncbi:MAG: GAF domain-containing protein [Chitinophagaceae bacterium]|nr:GAF domain-containing protein [Chitinophagaceae bacterium]